MKINFFTFLFILLLFTVGESSFGQCVTVNSAPIVYISSSAGVCTYSFQPSITVNSGQDAKYINFTLPTGASPSSITYCATSTGALTKTGCPGSKSITVGTYSGSTTATTFTLPCTTNVASNITATANANGSGNSCASGAVTITAPTPVKLSYFKGYSENGGVNLQWQTESETNSDYFMIERSENAKEFVSIERIESAGESITKKDYSYVDRTAAKGINYYRLRQVDKDGSINYSKIIDINQDGASEMLVYPNPSSGRFIMKGVDNVVSYHVFSSLGNNVDARLEKVGNEYRLNLGENPARGSYLLSVKTPEKTYKYRVVVE